MTEMSTPATPGSAGPAAFQDPDTQAGIEHLAAKVAPLLQTNRFDNVVDLLSLVADGIDMTDERTIEKLMAAFEGAMAAGWTLGNAARMAGSVAGNAAEPPSLFQLARELRDPEVRRGLHAAVTFLRILGRQTGP
ncbi:DUF1641 domain-containing protein [Geminicoccaceae bacterium 1502E]|nr:DUF1641 domain-containing protein [Geminicoccaceae bacterium 1502E]